MAIFSLNEVRTEQIKNIENDNFDSWPENALYGYYGGGQNNPSVNIDTVERIDFSNETFTLPGNELSQVRMQGAAVSTSSYGYFAYGYAPGVSSTVDRLDFSSETCSLPGKNLPQSRRLLAAVQTDSYGYFGGGYPVVATVSRIDFSNETGSAPGNELSDARYGVGAVSNDLYGYFAGGISPAYVATVDRIDFSNETVSVPGSNLTQARTYTANASTSSYGYFGGGIISPPTDYVTTVDRLDFSNEIVSAPGTNLTQARALFRGVSSNSYGYFCGGSNPDLNPPYVATVDRIDFSNETISAPGKNLSQGRRTQLAVSGGASYRPKGSRTYGYFGGGFTTGSYIVDTVDRIDFSNETTSAPGNELTQSRFGLAAVSTSSYGYFGGGFDPPIVDTVDRIDFSNETTFAPGNNLTQARYNLAAVSSSSYGYFGGGRNPPLNPDYVNTVDRIDFSNETTSAPGPVLTQARGFLAALSSNFYGYFAGGFAPPIVNTVDRIDFSNETTSAPGNNLSQARSSLAAVSSSSYGYFGGGESPPLNPDYVTTVDRLDFSNETTSAPGNNLSQARSSFNGLSN